MTDTDLPEQQSLDPDDWSAYRAVAHELLDACVDHLEQARERPWQPPASEALNLPQPLPLSGMDTAELAQTLVQEVMPYATGNTHPAFFGWVHGTGLASGLLAEMVAATMNSNCGGRDHGAVYIERCVIDWCCRRFGLPPAAGGIMTSGTSMATVQALEAARVSLLGTEVRETGIADQPALCVYAADGVHLCVNKAMSVMGIGSNTLRSVPLDPATGSICLKALSAAIAADRAAGLQPLAVVGIAGSVDYGRFDDLDALGDFCQSQGIWLHVDGAFGAWTILAEAPWSALASGIEKADSIAFDFHKWMSVQYAAGAVLVRDADTLSAAFGEKPAYLQSSDAGLASGSPWYCESGIELSRGFLALKVWTALKAHGFEAFGRKVTDNCRQASYMARLVNEAPELELSVPVIANICCFRIAPQQTHDDELAGLHESISADLQIAGVAVLSTTLIDGTSALRAAIVNHRTTDADVARTIRTVCERVRGETLPPGTSGEA